MANIKKRTSKKCIVVSKDGKYLTPRRSNGNLYEARTGWSKDIEDAKVFQSSVAASNSANRNGSKEYAVKQVKIMIVDKDE